MGEEAGDASQNGGRKGLLVVKPHRSKCLTIVY